MSCVQRTYGNVHFIVFLIMYQYSVYYYFVIYILYNIPYILLQKKTKKGIFCHVM